MQWALVSRIVSGCIYYNYTKGIHSTRFSIPFLPNTSSIVFSDSFPSDVISCLIFTQLKIPPINNWNKCSNGSQLLTENRLLHTLEVLNAALNLTSPPQPHWTPRWSPCMPSSFCFAVLLCVWTEGTSSMFLHAELFHIWAQCWCPLSWKFFSVSSNAALVPTEATAFSFRLLDYCVDLSSEGLWILHTLRERIASTHLESPGNSLSALHINRWLINQLDSDIISLVSRLQLSGSREY